MQADIACTIPAMASSGQNSATCLRLTLATVGIGLINVVMTIVAIALIDRVGRRALLLTGVGGTVVPLTLPRCPEALFEHLVAVRFANSRAVIGLGIPDRSPTVTVNVLACATALSNVRGGATPVGRVRRQ